MDIHMQENETDPYLTQLKKLIWSGLKTKI